MTSLLLASDSDKKTTALPFGDDGYECFVSKGSCRKCGCVAYGKQKCQRCERKFCAACAPRSLQTYGSSKAREECCVGCEPSLVVSTTADPILELEPASEPLVLSLEKLRSAPPDRRIRDAPLLHVPLSATATDTGKKRSPGDHEQRECVSGTQPQHKGYYASAISNHIEYEEAGDSEWTSPSSVADTSWASRYEFQQQQRQQQQQQQQQRAPKTPPTTTATALLARDLASTSLAPPLILMTPDAGCCTACQQYATGKVPCQTCGTKYCHGTNPKDRHNSHCLDLLDDTDGTCAKCHGRSLAAIAAAAAAAAKPRPIGSRSASI